MPPSPLATPLVAPRGEWQAGTNSTSVGCEMRKQRQHDIAIVEHAQDENTEQKRKKLSRPLHLTELGLYALSFCRT